MDKKAKQILKHYKSVIENRLFNEYDFLGFLIFIRSYIQKRKCPGIYELCDLVAHRNRDRGIVMDCIEKAIANNYETLPNSKAIRGYQGIEKEQWESEWKRIGIMFQINISAQTTLEIMLCLFSLLQNTEYFSNSGSGKIVLVQGKEGVLSLATTEGKSDSFYVCFSKYGPYSFCYEYPAGIITDIVETKRIQNELQLFADDLRII